jgi:hypothetical protein
MGSFAKTKENSRQEWPMSCKLSGSRSYDHYIHFSQQRTASAILASIERSLPSKAEPIPLSKDMAPSAGLEQVFAAAVDLANQLHHDEVEPLHLFAALFSQHSGRTSDILTHAGIYRQAVMQALRTQ